MELVDAEADTGITVFCPTFKQEAGTSCLLRLYQLPPTQGPRLYQLQPASLCQALWPEGVGRLPGRPLGQFFLWEARRRNKKYGEGFRKSWAGK